MSKFAQEAYAATAVGTDIKVPSILNGAPHGLLVGAPGYIPTHMSGDELYIGAMGKAASEVEENLKHVSNFLLNLVSGENPDVAMGVERYGIYQPAVRKALLGMVSRKVPGKLYSFGFEAITLDDLPKATVAAINKKSPRDIVDTERGQAFFLTYADLSSGPRKLGRVGSLIRLAVAGEFDAAGKLTQIAQPASISVRKLNTNDLIVASAIGQSRATSRVVEGHNLSKTIVAGLPSTGPQGGGSNASR